RRSEGEKCASAAAGNSAPRLHGPACPAGPERRAGVRFAETDRCRPRGARPPGGRCGGRGQTQGSQPETCNPIIDASQIGKRAWGCAGVLQGAGLSCFEYVEQLTLLLFLKMADQLTETPHNKAPIVPVDLGWKTLLPLSGAKLEETYRNILEELGKKS